MCWLRRSAETWAHHSQENAFLPSKAGQVAFPVGLVLQEEKTCV